MTTFKELGVSQPILKALEGMGFEEATPIQEQTIPLAMEEKDLIGQAQTGTGKTAAFGIPMIERFSRKERKIQGLVVAPTRELAVQVAEEINHIGKLKGIRALPVYGGQQMGRQIRALREGPQIVVATPGRLLDHMRRKTIRLQAIKVVVLDEADEMLNMGFIDDIRAILQGIRKDRQTLLFSATIPREIREIATQMMDNPREIRVKTKAVTVENIDQYFIEVPERSKFETLSNHLDIYAPERAIVFSRTKKRVDEIAEGLQARGFKAEAIHGDLPQRKRMTVLNQFKNDRVEILVATDVAARGLDISRVTHVYNFDIPQDPESYVHRVGRTGRAGETGEAISFITPREIAHLQIIQQVTKSQMKRMSPPTHKEARRGKQRVAIEKITQAIKDNELKDYRESTNELLNEFDSITVVSAALSLLTEERENKPVKLSGMQPISVQPRRRRGRGRGSQQNRSHKGNHRNRRRNRNKRRRRPKNHQR